MKPLRVVYDGKCPVCNTIVTMNHLRNAYDEVELVDARAAPELIATYRERGIEINDGFIIEEPNGRIYWGADAMAFLAAHERGSPLAILLLPFLSRRIGQMSYPVLKIGRKALLKVLGIPSIIK